MATYPQNRNSATPNFPTPLSRVENYNATFPSDILNNDKRKFYTQINFIDFLWGTPSGKVKLPIPLKLDDNLLLHWSPVSAMNTLTGMGQSAMTNLVGGVAASAIQLAIQGFGYASGTALNPLMFMQFQRPEFRQFSLSWVLTARNEEESKSIRDIIRICKRAASPTKASALTMGYPNIVNIKMHPDDIFKHMIFKPCIIQSVSVSYNGGPTPAFFKNGAPAVITLTLNIQEMQFWFREEIV